MKLPFSEWRSKRKMLSEPFPDAWRAIINTHVAHARMLSFDERELLEDSTLWLIADKNWEAAQGFQLTDIVRVTIAAQAALLILGLGDDCYDGVSTIIVHPTTMQFATTRSGPIAGTYSDSIIPTLGEAHYDGPVIIAWDAALSGARHPERGHNVVYHEFAHKLDMLDGVVDGTPPLETEAQVQRWIDVCTAEYEALRDGEHSVLDVYGSVDAAEFFAVATEAFFDLPLELEAEKPDLYAVLHDFYHQDPAARVRRSAETI